MTKEAVETQQKLNKAKKRVEKQATNPISGLSKAPELKVTKSASNVLSIGSQAPKIQEPENKQQRNAEMAPGLIATINTFNANKSHNRLYSGYASNPIAGKTVVNGNELANAVCSALKNRTDISELFVAIHNTCCEKLNSIYTGFGLYHETSRCIDFKLFSKIGGTYSSKIFQSDSENPIMECFTTQKPVILKDNKFLNIPYLKNSETIILPLMSIDKCLGIMLLGRNDLVNNLELLGFIANYCGLFIHNFELIERTAKYANTDTLTGMYTHRGFQEVLSAELEKAKTNKTPLSIVMFDVNNISKINRELGHAKGDEVIKVLAEKIKQSARNSDIAGRYGGDEIALILPNTNTADAKYLAEYITYCLSCCFIDDVGPVKVAVGISTYPDCSENQEKLLILAEQAMIISQAKGYKEGMSAIISSSDFNFWDDEALSSFAQVISKRHSQLGINYEEELVQKFNTSEVKSHNHLVEMVTSLTAAIDAKDPYTKGHSTSVSRYSEALARAINLPEEEVQRIALGAQLHDVGKIGIPENVLRKTDKLSDEEWEIMKQHPTIGAEKVLEPNPGLRDLIPMVKYHHEKIDGTGYPMGLKGDEIPLEARIISVADAYHALVSDRPYRKGMPIEKACAILKEGAGKHWDADLVRHFIAIAPSLSTSV